MAFMSGQVVFQKSKRYAHAQEARDSRSRLNSIRAINKTGREVVTPCKKSPDDFIKLARGQSCLQKDSVICDGSLCFLITALHLLYGYHLKF